MKIPYVCARCGYETYIYASMRNHLFRKKKPCPPIKNDIELTDEIKNTIMENKYYKVQKNEAPQQPQQYVINNVFNGSVNFMTFLSQMDPIDKYNMYINHRNVEQKGFEELVDETFASTVNKLENRQIDFNMKKQDFLEMVDKVSVCKEVEDFNIVFDPDNNKIKVYQDGTWCEHLLSSGVSYIVHVIKDYFIDVYEKYLIYNIETCTNPFSKQCYRERLQDCYKFLVCFDIRPASLDMTDSEILASQHGRHSYDISERCEKEYKAVKSNATLSEINRMKKDVIDIIKNNSRKTIKEIHKKVMELIKVDEDFRKKIAL